MTANGNPRVRVTRALDKILRKPKPAILGWRKSESNVAMNAPGGLGRVYITWHGVHDYAVNRAGVPLARLLPVLVVPGEPHEIVGIDFTHPDAVAAALNNEYGVPNHAASHQHGGADEIATATPAANAIPKADASGLLDDWVTPAALSDLSDVVLTALADGEILAWDAGTSKWVNAAEAGALVTSVNTQTGAVVLDADDIDDSATTHKFATAAELSKLAGIEAGANLYVHPNHTGDVTSAGEGATTIVNDAVTNAKAANMAQSTIKGRAAGAGTGDPTDLTATQTRAVINVADGADVTATSITALATKTTPVDADAVVITDSAASNAPKRTIFTDIKAFLKTYFDTLYTAINTAVLLTGDQSVAGIKTFTSNLIASAGAAITGLTVTPVSSVSTIQTNNADARLRNIATRSTANFIAWNVEDGSANHYLWLTKVSAFIGVMSGFAVEGFLGLGRTDGVDRAAKIKVFNDSTPANNYVIISPHNGTVGAQVDTLRVYGNGRVGIGVVPQGIVHAEDSGLGCLTWIRSGIAGSTITILSNGTITVGAVVSGMVSNGSVIATKPDIAIALSGTTTLTAGADTATITVNGSGGMTIIRTAGSNSLHVVLDIKYD